MTNNFTTNDLMQIALDMAGFSKIPEDSGIYYGGSGIKKVLFGIDIKVPELKIAKDLNYDLVIAHHPPMLGALHAEIIYGRHAEFMIERGIPAEAAWASVSPRMKSLASQYVSANHDHFPSIARLLDIPFMNIHAPLDELGRKIMQNKVDEIISNNEDATLKDIVDGLNELPEFETAYTKIEIPAGNENSKAGKTIVAHGALTNGGYEVANTWYEHGYNTVIYIHCPLAAQQRIKKEGKGNLIITGHIVSDMVGINPYVEKLRELGLEVTGISGIK